MRWLFVLLSLCMFLLGGCASPGGLHKDYHNTPYAIYLSKHIENGKIYNLISEATEFADSFDLQWDIFQQLVSMGDLGTALYALTEAERCQPGVDKVNYDMAVMFAAIGAYDAASSKFSYLSNKGTNFFIRNRATKQLVRIDSKEYSEISLSDLIK